MGFLQYGEGTPRTGAQENPFLAKEQAITGFSRILAAMKSICYNKRYIGMRECFDELSEMRWFYERSGGDGHPETRVPDHAILHFPALPAGDRLDCAFYAVARETVEGEVRCGLPAMRSAQECLG